MRGYTRKLVRASVRHRWMTLADRRPHLRRLAVVDPDGCPRASSPQKTSGASLLAVELPPGSRLDDTEKVTGQGVGEAAQDARGALGPHLRRPDPGLRTRSRARRRSRSTSCTGPTAERPRRSCRRGSPRCSPISRTFVLVSQGQRPARYFADHCWARHRRHQRDREPARERNALDSDHRKSDVDRRARAAGTAHRAKTAGCGRPRRLDRGAVRAPSVSRPSATSTPTSPNSTPATGSSRSGSS